MAAASIERDDGKHQVLSSVNSLQVHDTCYKSYIRQKCIAAVKKRKASENKSPSPGPSRKPRDFNFKELCVICGTEAGDAYSTQQRKKGRLSLGNVYVILI